MQPIEDYIKRRDWDTAIAECTKEISSGSTARKPTQKSAPNPMQIPSAYMNRGYVRYIKGKSNEDYEKAIEDLSSAIVELSVATPPPSPAINLDECYIRRAYAYYLVGNHVQAIADCDWVVQNSAKPQPQSSANELLGIIYGNQKQYKDAVEHFEKALIANLTSPGLLDRYREALKKMNNA